MDQSRSYWIQKQQPACFNSHHVLSSFGDSWEEQAFAEDATGPLGGCVWPPRSYTCSFCRREFRSAQALGGHMNVHRRDRARLKKNLSTTSNNNMINQVLEQQQQQQPRTTSFDICVLQNPNKICNPNLDLDHIYHPDLYSSSTVSIVRPFAFSFGQEHDQKGSPTFTCSKFENPQKRFHIADFGIDQDKVLGSNFTTLKKKDNQQIEVHLASELNSLVRKRCDSEKPIFNTKDDEQDCLIFKKRRIDRDDEVESVVPLERSTNLSLETLDLELRLGDHRP